MAKQWPNFKVYLLLGIFRVLLGNQIVLDIAGLSIKEQISNKEWPNVLISLWSSLLLLKPEHKVVRKGNDGKCIKSEDGFMIIGVQYAAQLMHSTQNCIF